MFVSQRVSSCFLLEVKSFGFLMVFANPSNKTRCESSLQTVGGAFQIRLPGPSSEDMENGCLNPVSFPHAGFITRQLLQFYISHGYPHEVPENTITSWWFGTWILFSIIYRMSSFPLANSYFSRWAHCTTNQIKSQFWDLLWLSPMIFPKRSRSSDFPRSSAKSQHTPWSGPMWSAKQDTIDLYKG